MNVELEQHCRLEIQDLEPEGLSGSLYDTVQPCDTTQVRSDSDFGVKNAIVQVYGNSNSQSNRWIELKVYVDSPDMLSYYGIRF
jgi:hypothetical protein